MKRSLLFLLFLCSSLVFSQVLVIDDFEDGTTGHFNLHTTYSGSTKGVLSTTPVVDSTTAAKGTKSLKITLIDDPGSGENWFVRFLSAMGSPAGNVLLNDTGFVGYWLKANRPYLSCGIILDDLNASGTGVGTNEISDTLKVYPDKAWHLYQWNVADTNKWYPFIASGNGMIQDPVSIDAVVFYAPDSVATGDTAIVYLDYVSFRGDGQLPVELSSFDAVVEQNLVDLRWITSTETNNRGFEIERKDPNSDYHTIGFVAGNGTTTAINGYTFSDKINTVGTYYYRLKQIDFDGTATYSNVIAVKIHSLPNEFSVSQNFPNPFNPMSSVTFNIPEAGMVNLSVFNTLGEKVSEVLNGYLPAGEHNATINAAHLSSGTYIYRITFGGHSLTRKLTVLK